jgi:hypothetical protein
VGEFVKTLSARRVANSSPQPGGMRGSSRKASGLTAGLRATLTLCGQVASLCSLFPLSCNGDSDTHLLGLLRELLENTTSTTLLQFFLFHY